ncbi:unnamed protein product [Ectocarpus sp. 12 AP-2014]
MLGREAIPPTQASRNKSSVFTRHHDVLHDMDAPASYVHSFHLSSTLTQAPRDGQCCIENLPLFRERRSLSRRQFFELYGLHTLQRLPRGARASVPKAKNQAQPKPRSPSSVAEPLKR